MAKEKEYQRFSPPQRLEHWVMVISFSILAVTGLPQKFAGDGWAETMIALLGGIEFVRLIHHAAAIVLLLGVIYHAVSLMYKVIVQRVTWSMYPQLQDAVDAVNAILYNIGLKKEGPRYDHFSFAEKAEYWALVWGTLIMAFTGFMLWNPIITSRFVSGEAIPAAKAAHGAEAILAVLAVVVWHFYNVHLRAFNRSMFSGKLPEHEMRQEHALELARLDTGEASQAPDRAIVRQRQRIFLPIAAVLSLVMIFGVFLFTTAETTAVTTMRRAAATVQVYAPQTKTTVPTRAPTATPQVAEATPSAGTPGAGQPTAAQPTAPAASGVAAKALPADHAGRSVCTACHATGIGGAPKSPADHAGRLDAQCTDCHKPK